MISKELLSVVLNKQMINCYDESIQIEKVVRIKVEEKSIKYNYEFGCIQRTSVMYDGEINIYELAHKCKEWALENNYAIKSEIINLKTDKGFAIALSILHCPIALKQANCFAYTEPEAIFKACQWILENK